MYMGIILATMTGFFFLIGILVFHHLKRKDEISLFTTSLAFVVIFGLLVFDLLPELIETKDYWLFFPLIIGFLILVILDKFIPHHHEHLESKKKNEHLNHLNHINTITIIALTIHNIIEGLTLYSVTVNDITSGVLMMLSISLHNIPLGFQIGTSIKSKKNNLFLITLLCISSLLGALIVIVFGNLNEYIINILLSLTFGMLLYILIFELFSEMLHSLKKKSTIYGIITGVIILIIALFI